MILRKTNLRQETLIINRTPNSQWRQPCSGRPKSPMGNPKYQREDLFCNGQNYFSTDTHISQNNKRYSSNALLTNERLKYTIIPAASRLVFLWKCCHSKLLLLTFTQTFMHFSKRHYNVKSQIQVVELCFMDIKKCMEIG